MRHLRSWTPRSPIHDPICQTRKQRPAAAFITFIAFHQQAQQHNCYSKTRATSARFLKKRFPWIARQHRLRENANAVFICKRDQCPAGNNDNGTFWCWESYSMLPVPHRARVGICSVPAYVTRRDSSWHLEPVQLLQTPVPVLHSLAPLALHSAVYGSTAGSSCSSTSQLTGRFPIPEPSRSPMLANTASSTLCMSFELTAACPATKINSDTQATW